MTEYTNISTRSLIKYALNVEKHSQISEDLNQFVRKNAKRQEDLSKDLRHLKHVNYVIPDSDLLTDYQCGFVVMNARLNLRPLDALVPEKLFRKQEAHKDHLVIISKQGELLDQTSANNVESNLRLRVPITTTMNHYVCDGYANPAIFVGTRQNQRMLPIELTYKSRGYW